MSTFSFMFTTPRLCRQLLGIFCLTSGLVAQVPYLLHHQGRVVVSGVNFNGTGRFRFALTNAAGDVNYWSNDGTVAGVPVQAVALPVAQGYFSLFLGDTGVTGMQALSPAVFQNSDVRLQVWFDDGTHGNQPLGPAQRIAAVAYALMAEQVRPGAVSLDSLGGLTPDWRSLLGQPDFSPLRIKLGVDQIDNTPDAAKPLSSAVTAALATKASIDLSDASAQSGITAAVAPLSRFTGAMAQAAAHLATPTAWPARRVNVIQIGDSTGADLFGTGTCFQVIEAYGFGGLQVLLSNYGGAQLTFTNVSFNNTRANSMLGQYSMDAAGASVSFYPDVWYFPQVPNITNPNPTYTPQNLTGFRVVWIKGSGAFKMQYSAYNVHGDALFNTPTWVDGATVDTSTGTAPIQATDVALPSPGLYRLRILQTAETPQLSYWGFLGASGFNRGGPYGQGGDYLSNYLLTPEANWAAQLAISNPDLITIQFKNNGGDTVVAWEAQMRTLLGYIRSYAPNASVVLVGNYNSQSDDNPGGPGMTMPQQRALMRRLAEEADGLNKTYIDASEIMGGSFAGAVAAGMMNYNQNPGDTVHANNIGKRAQTAFLLQKGQIVSPLDSKAPYTPPPTGVTAGTYGGAGLTPQITVGSDGRITSASNATVPFGFSRVVKLAATTGTLDQTVTDTDDGTLYDITTGSADVRLGVVLSSSVRTGWRIFVRKADTGTGRAGVAYNFPWIGGVFAQGDFALIYWDGTALQTIRLGLGSAYTVDPYQGGKLKVGQGVVYGSDSGPLDTSGAGSPEGVVAAPVGSTYRRTDGTPGQVFYVKESGTGTTGWTAK